MLKCTFGMTPSSLMVTVPLRPMIQNKPKATIMDFAPLVNILPFGMCQSLSNPMVASATSAAMGVLTPMPCIPVIVAPWAPGGKAAASPSTCLAIRATRRGNNPLPAVTGQALFIYSLPVNWLRSNFMPLSSPRAA